MDYDELPRSQMLPKNCSTQYSHLHLSGGLVLSPCSEDGRINACAKYNVYPVELQGETSMFQGAVTMIPETAITFRKMTAHASLGCLLRL